MNRCKERLKQDFSLLVCPLLNWNDLYHVVGKKWILKLKDVSI